MTLKLLLICWLCGGFAVDAGIVTNPSDEPQQWRDFMTSVNKQLEHMKLSLAEKDTQIISVNAQLEQMNHSLAEKDTRIKGLETELHSHISGFQEYVHKQEGEIEQENVEITKLKHGVDVLTTQQDVHQHGRRDRESDVTSQGKSREMGQTSVVRTPATAIAFHVEMVLTTAIARNVKLVFDHEVLDQGDGYNPTLGIYTVPQSGIYVLTWAILSSPHSWLQTQLIVEGVTRGASYTDSVATEYLQTTAVVVLSLNEGDRLYLRVGSVHVLGKLASDANIARPTFSGWKIF